jgi:hypothetical protein
MAGWLFRGLVDLRTNSTANHVKVAVGVNFVTPAELLRNRIMTMPHERKSPVESKRPAAPPLLSRQAQRQ